MLRSDQDPVDAAFESSDLDLFQFVQFGLTSNDPLVMLILREKIRQVFPLKTFDQVVNDMTSSHIEGGPIAKSPESIPIPSNLQGVPLSALRHDPKWSKGTKEVSLTMRKIKSMTDNVTCETRSIGQMSALVPLLAPLENESFKLTDLMPAIEYLRAHGGGLNIDSDHESFDIYYRFLDIVKQSFALSRYLDPGFIFVEEALGTEFEPMNQQLNQANARLSEFEVQQPILNYVPDNRGGSPQRLISADTLKNAGRVASVYRATLKIPGQNGPQPGPHARIATFEARNGPLWW